MTGHPNIPLPYLFSGLSRAKFNGRARLAEGDVERTVLFHNGSPVQVQSRLQEETLGRILLDEGRLTVEQYKSMLEKLAETGKRAGEILIQMGVLGPQDVFSALEFQSRKKLTNCFKMASFTFQIKEESVPPEMLIAQQDMAEVILSGIMVFYSVDRIMDEFPVDEETIFTRVSLPQTFAGRIGPKESRLLRSLDSGRALAHLMASNPDLQRLLSLLYAFHALFLVEATGTQRPDLTIIGLPGALPPRPAKVAEPPPPIEEEPEKEEESEEDFNPPTLASIMDGRIDLKLSEKILSMSRENHFELLGVNPRAKGYELKSAFFRLLRDYKLESIDAAYKQDKERELARRLLDQATMAYRVLADEESRASYVKSMREQPSAQKEVPPRIMADVEAQKGQLAMSAKRWGEAEELYNKAIELYPKEPSYYFLLGKLGYLRALAQTKPDKKLPEELRKPLLKALAVDPRYDEPRLYLGYISKRNGDLDRAIREFKGALECNPQNKLAISELRLLKRRKRLSKS